MIDAKKLQEIWTAHEKAEEESWWLNEGETAHAHRGWLLDAIAKAQEVPEPITSRVFEPTAEEVTACAVLAEVAGKPEREAVMWLARMLSDAAFRVGSLVLKNEARQAKQRPRVGPWVDRGSGAWGRFDDRGAFCGSVCRVGNRAEWWAARAFADHVEGVEGTEEQARAAVDAVLREWADVDGDDAPVMRVHVAAPLPPSVRLWTEEQIREAVRKAALVEVR